LELTEEITAERGLGVDLEGFRAAMADQQTRARSARKSAGGSAAAGDLRAVLEEHGATTFVGREVNEATATVLYADDDVVVLDRTPFYAESGGQIGDTGTLVFEGGTLEVFDTTLALDGLHRHHIQLPEASQPDDGLAVGQEVRATIDIERRAAIRRNHTGTHLLHSALRRVLGDHVKQQGSHVGPDRLRFDFSHFEALTAEQMTAVEDLANADILANPSCNHYETSKDEAEAAGAIAFFGDKYGDTVRVLEAGPHSTELCGGTHVSALGDIGPIRIVAEGSIGSNIRRIEALTGTAPIERLRDVETVLGRAAELVGVPVDDVLDGIEKRLAEARALRGELAGLRTVAALGRADELAESAEDGLVVALIDEIDRDGLRQLAMAVRDRDGVRAVVLGAAPEGGGAALVAAVATGSGLDAGALVAEAARTIGGGGRPNPEVTAVGGKAPEHLAEALEQARAAAQAG
jgi:alanyl-tRNA synthetase